MSTERFVSLPLITVNYIYNDLLLIVECVEWSCRVVDVEGVCLSVIVIDSTSFQVYGLISQEPYIQESVTDCSGIIIRERSRGSIYL